MTHIPTTASVAMAAAPTMAATAGHLMPRRRRPRIFIVPPFDDGSASVGQSTAFSLRAPMMLETIKATTPMINARMIG
jgi:hypothetical protein